MGVILKLYFFLGKRKEGVSIFMKNIVIGNFSISPYIYIPFVYLLWVTVCLLLKKIAYRKLRDFTKHTHTGLDDILTEAADFPIVLLIFTSGILVLENLFEFALDTELFQWTNIGFKAVSIIAVILFLDKAINGALKYFSPKIVLFRETGGVMILVVRMIIVALGVLIIMDNLGISITPILASLGIGSLAVALALQPTLESVFAGVQIIVDRPISVGHFIKLESGEEGYVEKIGWRSTWIRLLPNNMVIIPNKVLVSSRILNYYYPEKELAVLVNVGVDYRSDLDFVEKVTIEVASEVLKSVEGGVSSFKPYIRYHTFNEFSIDFTVNLRAKEFTDNYFIKHNFIKALQKRYNKEGIIIPFPIRTMEYSKISEGASIKK
ncbi:transporter, small conductance mechanosensitive ion channel MscS family protein [Candidatus Omnitrophus magneticus]|uniref:Transporter, small conductance mechanosensitive ion channel MscS family protein n=1 Tax=Candidatus Omnitrophus magneticus TaxID=1609969 RepID=A0A0F0CQZ6_9BACT|nr:transporter, small conductance mechanosensitive ion channel MscS family protein [Candidatus Omnitrophus magneticus]